MLSLLNSPNFKAEYNAWKSKVDNITNEDVKKDFGSQEFYELISQL